MSFKRTFISGLIAASVAFTGLMGSAQQASAGLSKKETAAVFGIGGFILGAAVAKAASNKGYGGASSWDIHVRRCYARYQTYEHSTDTYIGFDGNYHYCKL